MLANRRPLQVIFLALLAITWLIGGNIVIARHYRRVGRSGWSGFKPFAFPFRNFNRAEWLSLFALGVLSLALLAIAMSLNPR